MAYFDYEMPQNQGSGLGALVGLGVKGYLTYKDRKRQEELDAIAKQKAITDEHRQAASQKFMEDQARAVNTRQQQSQDQQNITFQQQQAKARGETATGIGKLFGAGRFGEAKAYAGAQQFMNPKTGKMEGVGLRQLPNEMPAPGEALTAPQAPEFVGPLETPEMANARAPAGPVTDLIDPGTEVQRQQDLRDKFGADTASLPQRQAEHAKATQAFQEGARNPGFELSFPSGEKVTMAGREQKMAAQADAKQQAQELLRSFGPNTPPDVLRAVAIQAGLIGAGVSNADKAPISNSGAAMQAQEGRVVITDKNNKAALERAKAKAVGKGLGGGGPSKSELAEARLVNPALAKELEDVTRKGGLRDNVIHMESTLSQLKNNPDNPVLWTNAIDAAIRTNTGRAAIKAQYDLYREHAKGTAGTFDSWLESKKNGGIGAEEKRNFMGSFESGYNELRGEAKAAFDNFRSHDTDPRVARNPAIANAYNSLERSVFGRMPGYGGKGQEQAPSPASAGAAHPSVDPVGATKTLSDGRKARKVGPNQWEIVP